MMITIRPAVIAILIAAASLSACSEMTACPNNPNLPIQPGTIIVSVLDSLTAQPIANGASGFVTSPGFSDSLHHSGTTPDSVIYSVTSAGTYVVGIDRPGYQHWVANGIVVSPGPNRCSSPWPVDLIARLQSAP